MLSYLLQGFLLGEAAAVQPGPLQAYLLSIASSSGWRRAVPVTFAPLLSDGPILILVLIVLTSLPEFWLDLLRVGGGLFLIYLAYGAYQSFRQVLQLESAAPLAAGQSLLKASLINLLNPNPYIFWTTIGGPIMIEAWREDPLLGIGFLVGFYGGLIGGLLVLAVVFSVTGGIDIRLKRFLIGASAIVLLVYGLIQIVRGLMNLFD